MPLPDPVAGGKLEEEVAIETARCSEIGILDLGVMAQPGGTGSGFEALLAT
ncbi:alpha-D-ribose 1-methylphosphonate 5-triphosphate synthase subunit PhnG [Neorhizobium galegae]|nr:alpha-D-ribose 1-methylphosphonate 5-triphosphate synthase subunit PhnG [Neorhizobium galegae]